MGVPILLQWGPGPEISPWVRFCYNYNTIRHIYNNIIFNIISYYTRYYIVINYVIVSHFNDFINIK